MRTRMTRLVTLGLLTIAVPAVAQWTWTPETGRLVNLDRMPKETPELQVEFARSLLIGNEYSNAFNETNKFIKFYGDSDWADQNQKLRGDIHLADLNYVKAAEEYQLVISGYPSSPLYDEVIRQQYVVGDSLFDKGQAKAERIDNAPKWRLDQKLRLMKYRPLKRAIDVYTMVIDNQPFTDTAAEAQYKVGLCYYTRDLYQEAAFEYRRVLEDYNTSIWVNDALYGLTKAYEKNSGPAECDQAPSQLTIDTVARFKRQFPDDPRGEDMDAITADMRERIAKQHLQTGFHYVKRNYPIGARMSFEKVVNQYPDTDAVADARKWLDENPPDGSMYTKFIASRLTRG
ncbi:MAG: outer membrane protein assembly factor BamD [Candidatus Hydrogenedentota bacterium]